MAQVRPDPIDRPLTVEVSQSGGVWTAECDVLGLVTEAGDLEALKERVREIAPELAELNGVGEPTALRLRFAWTSEPAARPPDSL